MNRREALRALALGTALTALPACSSPSNGHPPVPDPTGGSPETMPHIGSTSVPARSEPPTTAPPPMATTSPPWAPGNPATYVNHGPPDTPLVALTFHFAGSPTLGVQLLDLLKAHNITSTLFAVGDWLTAHRSLGQRALDDGHELGNHTKSHQPMLTLDRAQVHAEIAGGAAALEALIGSIGRWFRPSGTAVPNTVILEEAGKVGYPVSVGYDIDSLDYTEPGAAAVIANVTPALHPGAIVSLHFGHADTLAALPTILKRIAGSGLRTATVGQLLTPAPAR